ncbi:hypothetical protein HW555_001591 [Spodoptera exigua]|uniref:Uncharacterized protein n=1 Tax=Spodoptera exigua TaxID=7107 RepID=A0A835L8P7_SPOEX|nr:hypothetical protein HW555_001591 [Spodoptera exigua]
MFSARICQRLVVVYLCIASVFSAPMQLPFLPMQYGMNAQLPFLRQMTPNLQSPALFPQQQPLVIVLPNATPNGETDDRYVNLNEQLEANLKSAGHVDENKDAVVIDANDPKAPEMHTKNAVVYLPNEGRYSIGQIISYIPFLPIEINVPDTISWITHLLTGGIFRPGPAQAPVGTKTLPNKPQVPLIVMPYPGLLPNLNQ